MRIITPDRKHQKRIPKVNILIAGEGKTERIYFDHFDDGKKGYTIKFARGNDTDPLSLVKNLNNTVKRLGLDLKDGDKAFCVFDTDDCKDKEKILLEAITFAKKNKIDIIFSTPSIELWFLLHYTYTTAAMTNKELLTKLKKYIPKYEKTLDVYDIVNDKLDTAIKNSKKLAEFQRKNGKFEKFSNANPYTDIYKIVEYLEEKRDYHKR